MATIIISGGTGLLGQALSEQLVKENHDIIILTRSIPKNSGTGKIKYAKWNIPEQTIDASAISIADHIIHLAGANVAKGRWTRKRKIEIISSRVDSGRLLVKALKEIPNKVQTFISASAIGYYGPDPQIPNLKPFIETDPSAKDFFLAQTCKLWEETVDPVSQLGIRLVKLRIGIVLSEKGGALKEFSRPLKFGLATILGSGKQIMSWIHIDDLVRMIFYVIEKPSMNGVYNAVAPKPVSNKELIINLARAKRKNRYLKIRVPAIFLKIALGGMSIEVLKSATVSSGKIEKEGFQYKFPVILKAMKN